MSEAYRFPVVEFRTELLPVRMIRTIPDPAILLVLVVVVIVDTIRGIVAINRPRFWSWWYHGRERQGSGGYYGELVAYGSGWPSWNFRCWSSSGGCLPSLLLVLGTRFVDVLPPLLYAFAGRKVTLRAYLSVGLITLFNLFVILVLAAKIST